MQNLLNVGALSLLLVALPALSETLSGRVVGITDGDTLKILDNDKQQHKIRLAGIDAPESKQPFGTKSKQSLAEMVFQKDVTLECGKTDRYKRLICAVMLEGEDINLKQVESGMAWWYRKYAKEQTAEQRKTYESAETDAKGRKVGLWADAWPMPPWEFRKKPPRKGGTH
jgi:endonuclease YncB( thermonuclease family)